MNVNYPSGGIASLLSAQGRDGDSMLVHMSPNEVQGLQNLAMAAGGSLSINPDTGLYEASFLKKLLPTLLGVGLSFIPGVGPLAAAGLVGAGETIRTGDLGKGLMAGLGAYGGAGLAGGLAGAGSLAKAGADKIALQQTLGGEAAKSTLQTAAQEAARKGVQSYGSSMLGGVSALKDAGLSAAAKGLGSTLGTTGIGSLGMTAANVMTPDYQMPKGTDEDSLYYISEGYDPEKGFLGGRYTKQYPGLPTGYAEGGDVEKEAPKQDLKAYYQSLLAPPQQAPQQNAALQQYMSDLNKFVATSGPTAPKTSPTYVAPPPPPPEVKKPDAPTPPVKPPGTPTGPFDPNDPNSWMNNIDPDILRQMQDGTFNPFAGAAGRFGGDFGAGRETRGAQQGAGVQQGAGTQQQDAYDPTSFQYDPFVSGYTPPSVTQTPAQTVRQTPTQDIMQMPDQQAMTDYAGGTPNFDMGDQMVTPDVYSNFEAPAPQQPVMPTPEPMRSVEDFGVQDYMREYGLDNNFGDFNLGNMYASGGQLGSYSDGGRMLRGPGDGMSDSIPAEIRGRRGRQPARLADGEFVVPADVVSHLGNGSTEAGSRKLYKMMDNIRRARTGKTRQAPQVRAERYLPRKK